MNSKQKTILIVDDEPLNQLIISEYLESADAGYSWDTAEDGEIAWKKLIQNPEKYSAILLDRMMPRMDGMEVLKRIKAHHVLKEIPVIMQTARASREDIEEGIKAGAYYYLTKPFLEDALISIVRTAVNDHHRYLSVRRELDGKNLILRVMQSCRFEFSSLKEAYDLSALLSQACPNPESVVTGLVELMVNAVEHGNLGISYDEKGRLNESGNWKKEVERRLELAEMCHKRVEVTFERNNGEIFICITDQGEGFEFDLYLEISAERGADNHGRGIAMARMLSFERVEYQGKGNSVLAVIRDPVNF